MAALCRLGSVAGRLSLAAALLLLAACSEQPPTVIDGSSPDAFERTSAEARREIPDADRLVFDRAINAAPARRYGADDPQAIARVTFDGMTAAQVVKEQKSRE